MRRSLRDSETAESRTRDLSIVEEVKYFTCDRKLTQPYRKLANNGRNYHISTRFILWSEEQAKRFFIQRLRFIVHFGLRCNLGEKNVCFFVAYTKMESFRFYRIFAFNVCYRQTRQGGVSF